MRWLLVLVGAVLGSAVGDEEGALLGLLLGAVVAYMIGQEQKRVGSPETQHARTQNDSFEQRAMARIAALTQRVEQLEQTVSALQATQAGAVGASAPGTSSTVESTPLESASVESAPLEPTPPASQRLDERGALIDSGPTPGRAEAPESHSVRPPDLSSPLDPVIAALRSFFFGGNTVVRVGIVILTIGVGLLVKYAADQAYFPLEARLSLAAAMGLGLVVIGYRQQATRRSFGTALQGGGVAAMYLVTFFAYYAYQLLPGSLTLLLLIGIAALSSLLAVAQNAQQLAVFGAIGGFLSPVLASSGGGSHVSLFAYYTLLNLAIASMAVFRSWRVLNWVGFAFTFGVASAWGALKYEPSNMPSASAFLGVFFVLYVLNGTLFTRRLPEPRRGGIDTTLTFGTPLATLALAGGMFRLEHLYLALSCVLMSGVYFAFASWLLRRGEPLLALARAYIAIGIGIATLAIPFALDDALATSLAWSAEASGLVWVGISQRRLRTRVGGYVLYAAALLSLCENQGVASPSAGAMFSALLAVALGFGAVLVERQHAALHKRERVVGRTLFGLGLWVWAFASATLINLALPGPLSDLSGLFALAITALLLELGGTRLSYTPGRQVARFSFPVLLLGLLAHLFLDTHPFAHFGWLGYAAAIAASYFVLYRQRLQLAGSPRLRDLLHASAGYTIATLLLAEAHYFTADELSLASGWVVAASLIAPSLVAAAALTRRPAWPVAVHERAYVVWTAWPIALLLNVAAVFGQLATHAASTPLPYLPLLNPLDLAQGSMLACLLLLVREPALQRESTRRCAHWAAAGAGFIGLNAAVVHSAEHLAAVPFEPWQVPSSPLVQSVFSILWSVLALIAMVVAHRHRRREVWLVGALLLCAVVLKLFFVDLSQLGGVAKIITFLAVGVLLLLVGYLAPVPPAHSSSNPTS